MHTIGDRPRLRPTSGASGPRWRHTAGDGSPSSGEGAGRLERERNRRFIGDASRYPQADSLSVVGPVPAVPWPVNPMHRSAAMRQHGDRVLEPASGRVQRYRSARPNVRIVDRYGGDARCRPQRGAVRPPKRCRRGRARCPTPFRAASRMRTPDRPDEPAFSPFRAKPPPAVSWMSPAPGLVSPHASISTMGGRSGGGDRRRRRPDR